VVNVFPCLLIRHGIPQCAHSFHTDLHHVARDHRPDAFRGTSGYEVTGIQRHHLRYVPDHNVQRDIEVASVRILPDLAIQTGMNTETSQWLGLDAHLRPDGPERI
jgi:hypothetical protein